MLSGFRNDTWRASTLCSKIFLSYGSNTSKLKGLSTHIKWAVIHGNVSGASSIEVIGDKQEMITATLG